MFKHYGQELIDIIRENELIGTFLQDYGISKNKELKPEVYFLFDVNGSKQYGHYLDISTARLSFMKMIARLKQKPYYVIDYPFDSNRDGHLHVVVLKIPFPEKFEIFLKGEYSKMYSDEEIEQYIPKKYVIQEGDKTIEKVSKIYQVLTRDPDYKSVFADQCYDEFRVRITDFEREWDFPPFMPNEILRHNL